MPTLVNESSTPGGSLYRGR